ncbi:MAG: serine/threonine protein kinase [Planctomycetes bacterium]|nr:serine/threonine protein kinase [Planctomycetota bacterium]
MNPSVNECSPLLADLNADDQQRLASILEQYLIEFEKGLPVDREQLIARHADLAEPLRAYLKSIHLLHEAAGGMATEGAKAEKPLAATSTESPALGLLGDYRIGREIGRGGMGVVYEARQISLDRQVAIKVLPFVAVLDQKQIARFKNEAQAAAQLHHPHIVPVYSVGCERGVHYYAMQLIEGQSLAEVIGAIRNSEWGIRNGECDNNSERTNPDLRIPNSEFRIDTAVALSTQRESDSPAFFRTVARLGVEAAEALQHAHEQGVIHRDVKPSNLMIDRAGKLWITDFGLARVSSDSSLTMTGDVLGTARYMSPEQAAGRTALVDERSDIYSLGITLYEAITLHRAFDGEGREQILRDIAEAEPLAPRRINPAIPRDLETIVLTACAKERHDRYETAGELADDLKRFLAGEPTRARRATLLDRSARWARRHRRTVAAAAVLLVVVSLGLVVSTILLSSEQQRTRAALAESQTNLDRAETNYRVARGVVDSLISQHAQQLAEIPGTEQARADLLRDSLGYYELFIRQAGDDPTLRSDLAVTYTKVGIVKEQIGSMGEAVEAYRTAAELFERLIASDPSEAAPRRDLARCLNNWALLLGRAGKTDAAEREFHKAIQLQEQLIADNKNEKNGDVSDPLYDLALTHNNLGLLYSQTGRANEAQNAFDRALAMQTKLVAQQPDDRGRLASLAATYNNVSHLQRASDVEAARRANQRAIGILEKLHETHPQAARHQNELAICYSNFGALDAQAGKHSEAGESYRKAISLQQQLRRKAPGVVRYRRDLAVSYNNLGRVLTQVKRLEDAETAFRSAESILALLVRDDPEELSYRSSLGGVYNNLGRVYSHSDRHNEALAAYREAVQHQRFAVEQAPRVSRFRQFLMAHYDNYAEALRRLDRHAQADQIAAARQQLRATDPATQHLSGGDNHGP